MSRNNTAGGSVAIARDDLSTQPTHNPADHRGVKRNAQITVDNPNVQYSADYITSRYLYERNHVEIAGAGAEAGAPGAAGAAERIRITPQTHEYTFRTKRHVPRVGMMLVGWGGNNGSTVTAAIHANKNNVSWQRKEGLQKSNYFGSLTQSTTVRIGSTSDGKEVHIPFSRMLPMVSPNDLAIGGWDINGANLAEAARRAAVLDYDLQRQLAPALAELKPLPSIYYPDFIAGNQSDRANNVIAGSVQGKHKQRDLEHIRKDIRDFKAKNQLDTVIVLWTANTERFTDVRAGLNMTAADIQAAIARSDSEVSPSNVFAVASILEGCAYINGSPQNTLVPGIVALAAQKGVFVGGDDFKSGQTKMKSVLVDFLVSAGIKPASIVSYNHLGNNDGKNLNEPQQFRSKEISKSNVVDDMVASNHLLYAPGEHPDHCVVIKYVPFVGDSKRALDEYTSVIFMNGLQTISMHNTCEDSLLASPLIIDLVVLTELMTRIQYRTAGTDNWSSFHPVLSLLSYLLKAPAVPEGTPVINALMKQHRCITNILSACAGVAMDTDMLLEYKTHLPKPMPQIKARL